MSTDHERLVFGPFSRGDGTEVFGDPIAIYRRLVLALEGEHNELLAKTQEDQPEPVRLEAEDRLVPAARIAFGLADFIPESGEGATDREVLHILRHYVEWMDDAKKKGVI